MTLFPGKGIFHDAPGQETAPQNVTNNWFPNLHVFLLLSVMHGIIRTFKTIAISLSVV